MELTACVRGGHGLLKPRHGGQPSERTDEGASGDVVCVRFELLFDEYRHPRIRESRAELGVDLAGRCPVCDVHPDIPRGGVRAVELVWMKQYAVDLIDRPEVIAQDLV